MQWSTGKYYSSVTPLKSTLFPYYEPVISLPIIQAKNPVNSSVQAHVQHFLSTVVHSFPSTWEVKTGGSIRSSSPTSNI